MIKYSWRTHFIVKPSRLSALQMVGSDTFTRHMSSSWFCSPSRYESADCAMQDWRYCKMDTPLEYDQNISSILSLTSISMSSNFLGRPDFGAGGITLPVPSYKFRTLRIVRGFRPVSLSISLTDRLHLWCMYTSTQRRSSEYDFELVIVQEWRLVAMCSTWTCPKHSHII